MRWMDSTQEAIGGVCRAQLGCGDRTLGTSLIHRAPGLRADPTAHTRDPQRHLTDW